MRPRYWLYDGPRDRKWTLYVLIENGVHDNKKLEKTASVGAITLFIAVTHFDWLQSSRDPSAVIVGEGDSVHTSCTDLSMSFSLFFCIVPRATRNRESTHPQLKIFFLLVRLGRMFK